MDGPLVHLSVPTDGHILTCKCLQSTDPVEETIRGAADGNQTCDLQDVEGVFKMRWNL